MKEQGKALLIYEKYMMKFDLTNINILRKYEHTKRVLELAIRIAELEELTEHEKCLTETCAILHDIGRAEQMKRYNTYSDLNSIDHGKLGIIILFEEMLINEFTDREEDYSIIKDVIYYHNKDLSEIPKELNEETTKILKIIRDADKIDIFYTMLISNVQDTYRCRTFDGFKINPLIYKTLIEEKTMLYKEIKNPLDKLISHISFMFDFNFKVSYEIMEEEKYLDKMYELYDGKDKTTTQQFDDIFLVVKTVLQNKLTNR